MRINLYFMGRGPFVKLAVDSPLCEGVSLILMPRFESNSLTPETLGGLKARGVNLWCWCDACSYNKTIEIDWIIGRLGETFPVPSVASRMKCSNCKSRKIAARPDWVFGSYMGILKN